MADEETVGIIRNGYRIPFNSLPPETGVVPNNKSCVGKEEFVWSEMIRYTKLGCVQEVDGSSRVMLPLSVVFSNKTRLVVDASRHLNPWVKKESTKLDSLDHVGELLKPGMYVAVDDLDSGYWHLALHPESYQFCGNSCTDPKTGKVHFFQWKVLFLCITSAVTVFTRITKPIKIYLRLKCGLIILIYIDNLMVPARTYDECLYMKFFAVDVHHKSLLEPSGCRCR